MDKNEQQAFEQWATRYFGITGADTDQHSLDVDEGCYEDEIVEVAAIAWFVRAERAALSPSQSELDKRDAARYRFIRRKVCIIGETDGARFQFINMPRPTYIAPMADVELDAAIDAARAAQEKANG